MDDLYCADMKRLVSVDQTAGTATFFVESVGDFGARTSAVAYHVPNSEVLARISRIAPNTLLHLESGPTPGGWPCPMALHDFSVAEEG